MLRPNLFVDAKDLVKTDPAALDELITSTLGINSSSLRNLRSQKDSDAIMNTAKIMADQNLGHMIVTNALAIILHRGNGSPAEHVVQNGLDQRYNLESLLGLTRTLSLPIPKMHLLRAEAGAYSGNLMGARSSWPFFQPNRNDWLYSVCIPETISKDEAYLLGVYWARGQVSGNGELKISIRTKDAPYAKLHLDRRIQEAHNISCLQYQRKIRGNFKGVKQEMEQPIFSFGNGAVATWLMEDIGMNPKNAQRGAPLRDDVRAQSIHFISGFLSAQASFRSDGSIVVSNKDRVPLYGLSTLIKRHSVDARLKNRKGVKSYTLTMGAHDHRVLIEQGLIVDNPNYITPSFAKQSGRSASYQMGRISAALRERNGVMKVADVASHIGLGISTTREYIAAMVEEGRLYRVSKGCVRLPNVT